MAISKTVTLSSGLTVASAYIRVDTVQGSKSGLSVAVDTYLSEEAFLGTGPYTPPVQPTIKMMINGKEVDVPDPAWVMPPAPAGTRGWGPQGYIEREFIDYVPDVSDVAPNFLRQAYETIKTGPRYAGAKDV